MELRFDGIDGVDSPRYPIVEKCKDFLNDEHTRDRYYDKKKESTIKKQESELVSEILRDLGSGNGVEEIVKVDNGVILISALCDFVSSKYALNCLYQMKYLKTYLI